MAFDERKQVSKRSQNLVDELRGASRLAVEATQRVTDLVEAMHLNIAGGPDVLGRPFAGAARFFTTPIYGSIRGVARLAGGGIDLALARLAPLLGERAPRHGRDAVLAVLNGVLGDFLAESGNPLAIDMRLRHDGHPLELGREALRLALPQAGGKLLVMVHGSCRSDLQWNRQGHDHGAALSRDLGFTPVYLHYNSGLHVSQNGRAFAAQLEALVEAWPQPIEDLVIVAHSMGGLVSRSACHLGEEAHHRWRGALRRLVCLGTPHHGAPLERGGQWVGLLLGITRYSAPLARLGKIRSAGVTDMRYGSVREDDWQGRDRFAPAGDRRSPLPLPTDVQCYAIAATVSPEGGGRLMGDGLVPVNSALGRHARPEMTLGFPEAHQWVAHRTDHFDLLSRAEVYATLRAWLSA
jgi:PGAP1-like protein